MLSRATILFLVCALRASMQSPSTSSSPTHMDHMSSSDDEESDSSDKDHHFQERTEDFAYDADEDDEDSDSSSSDNDRWYHYRPRPEDSADEQDDDDAEEDDEDSDYILNAGAVGGEAPDCSRFSDPRYSCVKGQGHCVIINNLRPEEGHFCLCRASWRGTRCEVARVPGDPCASGPCDSGGTCHNVDGNAFACSCIKGYSGMKCEHKISTSNKCPRCRNGGVCVKENKSFACGCNQNYTGALCETPIVGKRKMNDDDESGPSGSKRICPNGWYDPPKCRKRCGNCARGACDPRGTCQRCSAGYTGRSCTTVDGAELDLQMSFSGTYVPAISNFRSVEGRAFSDDTLSFIMSSVNISGATETSAEDEFEPRRKRIRPEEGTATSEFVTITNLTARSGSIVTTSKLLFSKETVDKGKISSASIVQLLKQNSHNYFSQNGYELMPLSIEASNIRIVSTADKSSSLPITYQVICAMLLMITFVAFVTTTVAWLWRIRRCQTRTFRVK